MRSNAKKVFQKLQAKFDAVKREAPKILGNEGVKLFMQNFKTESFEGSKWKQVQRREPGTFAYKYPKKKDLGRRTRPILIGKTRRLKNATNTSLRSATTSRIRWAISSQEIPYAAMQNKKRKFMGAGRNFSRKMKMKFTEIYRKRLK